MSDGRVEVRWASASDGEFIAGIMQMNDRPGWEAFEERFVVAEDGGRIVGVMPYGVYGGVVRVGEVVADPWGGERRLAVALYRGMERLAREVGASEVRVEGVRRVEYLVDAGYHHGLRGWTVRVGEEAASKHRPGFTERVGRALGKTSVPGM